MMVFSTTLLFSQALITHSEDAAPIDGNAMLEIRPHIVPGSNPAISAGGILIPQVDLVETGSPTVVSLPGMDTPTVGLMVFNLGTNVDAGLWYYDAVKGWVIYSNSSSNYALEPGNYGEMFEFIPVGDPSNEYTIYNAYWTPWTSAATPTQLGDNFNFFGTDPATGDVGTGATASVLEVKTNGAGIYQVNISATIEAVSSGIELIGVLAVDGVVDPKINFRFNFQTSNDVAALTASGIITLGAGEKVDFRFKSVSATETIGILNMNMTLTKIGAL